MKKITLLLLMLIFCVQLSFAQEEQAQHNPIPASAPSPLAANPLVGEERALQGRVSAKPIEEGGISARGTSARNSGEGYSQETETVQAEPEESYEEITSYFNTEEPAFDSNQTTVYEGHAEYTQYQFDAEGNTIELENARTHTLNLSKPQRLSAKSLSKKPTFHPIQDELKSASMFSTQEYNIKSVSTDYKQTFGNFSFGTMYNSKLNKASGTDSTALFAKYEWKYAALGLGFSKSRNYNKNVFEDEFFFMPEIKITKRLSLLDVVTTDVSQINKSNEIVLRYTPRFKNHEDDIQLELGAGQSFYNDNFTKSSVRFSTKFKL